MNDILACAVYAAEYDSGDKLLLLLSSFVAALL